MLYRSPFPRDVQAEFERLQNDLQSFFETAPQIRGAGRGSYPALNVGRTAEAVEVWAFAPGLDPAAIEVQLDRGVLTLAGERAPLQPVRDERGGAPGAQTPQQHVHLNERSAGRFRRVISLPEDIDPQAVEARYRDGVLHVRVARRAAAQPRRIDVH